MRSLSRAICFAATLAGTSPSAQIRLDFNNDAHPDVIRHLEPGPCPSRCSIFYTHPQGGKLRSTSQNGISRDGIADAGQSA